MVASEGPWPGAGSTKVASTHFKGGKKRAVPKNISPIKVLAPRHGRRINMESYKLQKRASNTLILLLKGTQLQRDCLLQLHIKHLLLRDPDI
jgi:hypothetical protein